MAKGLSAASNVAGRCSLLSANRPTAVSQAPGIHSLFLMSPSRAMLGESHCRAVMSLRIARSVHRGKHGGRAEQFLARRVGCMPKIYGGTGADVAHKTCGLAFREMVARYVTTSPGQSSPAPGPRAA